MNTVLLIIIGILLTVELGLLAFCDYWRENNTWKWYTIKTINTILIVFYFIHDKATFNYYDVIFGGVIGFAMAIDLVATVIEHKSKKKYEC